MWRAKRKKILATYFYGGKEAALAVSHYIEGRALTSRKKNLHTGRDQAYSQLIVSRPRGPRLTRTNIETFTKKVGMKSGAA